jgi:tRNA(fMet)-specific endonuclease VapC
VTRFLLDTNILSDFVKNPAGLVASRIELLKHNESVCTSIIVAAELRYGAVKKNSIALSRRIEELLKEIEVLPLAPDADCYYGDLRAKLERRGRPVGANDMLIAAHALAADCILVTDNAEEFHRIPGLIVQNWIRP